jgi:hypothetical protein
VALNPVIKFTTLFGLLAVELAIELPRHISKGLAVAFFLASLVFVWRSFYGMRIETGVKSGHDAPAPAPQPARARVHEGRGVSPRGPLAFRKGLRRACRTRR